MVVRSTKESFKLRAVSSNLTARTITNKGNAMSESTVSKETRLKWGTSAGELVKWLESVPKHAVIHVRATKDYGPREPSETFIKATWKE